MAEARRHLLETLRGRAFEPGLDTYIADQASPATAAASPQ
ncbi:hypothetical protein AQF52_0061 [Streptomyces venezuelae]|nr:hypothetical protein AQF52_0061 [Streptomyces venezuelae]CUM44162.1 hypothetical protein BN2537_17289 [Streptomyces venezuelae]